MKNKKFGIVFNKEIENSERVKNNLAQILTFKGVSFEIMELRQI